MNDNTLPVKLPIPSNITKEELNELDIESLEVPVTLIDDQTSREEIATVAERLSGYPVLGLDTETKPSFEKGVVHKVATLQLSSMEESVVVRLSKFGKKMPLRPFRKIIESPAIVKTGVGISDDARALLTDMKWKPAGILELNDLTEREGIEVSSLSKIYAVLFGKRISKGQRLSDWEKDTLTETQIHYAALDAWAGIRIFGVLEHQFDPSLLRNNFAPLTQPGKSKKKRQPNNTHNNKSKDVGASPTKTKKE